MTSSEPSQLPLPFSNEPAYHDGDFLRAPSNAEALTWLERVDHWPGRRLAIWGAAGCGKTHLLRLWARRSDALYLAGPALPSGAPQTALAIDNADVVTDETGFLHLLNGTTEAGLPILLAARTPPKEWPVRLPDLASRLRAITTAAIAPADDALLRLLLFRLLAERQVEVPPAVQQWLLIRLPRTAASVREAVARLDYAALAGGGPITRALAKAVLGDLIVGDWL